MSHSVIPRQVRLTVFILTFCVIVLEISYTRVLAWVFHYHFAFFAVSLGICGLGLGGYMTHLFRAVPEETADSRRVFWFALAFPPLACITLVVSVQWIAVNFPGSYFATGVTLILPFPLAGAALASMFRRYSARCGRLYAVDLAGAAVAAVASALLLNALSAVDTVLFACSLAALCPLAFLKLGWPQKTKWRYSAYMCLALCLGLFVVNLNRGVFSFPFTSDGRMTDEHYRAVVDVQRERSRDFRREREKLPESVVSGIFREMAGGHNRARLLHTEFNAFGRTDVLFKPQYPDEMEIWLNGESPAFMLKFDGDYGALEKWKSRIGFLPYRIRSVVDVLSLGSGVGMDVHIARMGGARNIDAVEINPAMTRVLTKFRSFGGDVCDQPGVECHQSEGRVFVKRSKKKYDLIVSALTVMSKGHAGAMIESYVSTLEAAQDYYDHLTEKGMVAYFIRSPLSAERWFVTCLETLKRKLKVSHTDALSHLAILTSPRSPFNYLVLMSRSPFSADELDVMEEFASQFGRRRAVIPGRTETSQVQELRRTGSYPTTFQAQHGLIDINPATDNRPFFNDVHVSLPRAIREMLYLALSIALVFGVSAALQISRAKTGGSPIDRKWLMLWTVYFAPLGVGFMLVEIGLIQAFILLTGSPTQTVALVLLGLLSGGACASYFSQGIGSDCLVKYAVYIALSVAAATLLLSQSTAAISDALLGAGKSFRILSILVISAVIGAPMGALFPTGLRLVAHHGKGWVPYFWGVNGVASVVGSVLAATGAKYIGFSGVMLSAALIYLLAAICVRLGKPILQIESVSGAA